MSTPYLRCSQRTCPKGVIAMTAAVRGLHTGGSRFVRKANVVNAKKLAQLPPACSSLADRDTGINLKLRIWLQLSDQLSRLPLVHWVDDIRSLQKRRCESGQWLEIDPFRTDNGLAITRAGHCHDWPNSQKSSHVHGVDWTAGNFFWIAMGSASKCQHTTDMKEKER